MGDSRWPNSWPTDGTLPERVQAFVEWLVTPEWEREIKTQNKYAEHIGVDRGTLTDWKKDPRVRRAIEARADELNLAPERIQEVMNAVFNAAKAGDMKAATLFLSHADKLAPKRVVVEDKRIANLSEEEFALELEKYGLKV